MISSASTSEGEPEIVEAYENMPNVGMKSDLLRYLLLSIEGVYTGTYTVALKPIDLWVPETIGTRRAWSWGSSSTDTTVPPGPTSPLASVLPVDHRRCPGHPVFRKMVKRVLSSLKELSETHQVPINQIRPSASKL